MPDTAHHHRYIDVRPGDRVDVSGPATIEVVHKSGTAARLMVAASAAVLINHVRQGMPAPVPGVEYCDT
jgi:hypothetical protein